MIFDAAALLSLSSEEVFAALTADRPKSDVTVVGRRRGSVSDDAPEHVDGANVVIVASEFFKL